MNKPQIGDYVVFDNNMYELRDQIPLAEWEWIVEHMTKPVKIRNIIDNSYRLDGDQPLELETFENSVSGYKERAMSVCL